MDTGVRIFSLTRFKNEITASVMSEIWGHVISEDELALYYTNGFLTDILVATRFDRTVPFGIGVPVSNVNSPQ